jgi:hypothetical protein
MMLTTASSCYVDNLALADLYLAHVRKLLERRGEWDSSAVIVMGDHSWRTSTTWLGSLDWTEEDQAASDGGAFDDRPAYVVKLPGQRAGSRLDASFAAIRTRALLDAVLRERLHTADDLNNWVE